MRLSHFILLPLLTLVASSSTHAADPVDREDQFKAAYFFNFLKFVEWPASVASDELTVCVVGSDGVYAALADNIDSKRAGTRRLSVRHLTHSAPTVGCNALYVEAMPELAPVTATPASAAPILTVSDANGFTRRGGMIELFTSRNRLRFTINVDNAHKAGLRISSNLLQLAAQVEGSER